MGTDSLTVAVSLGNIIKYINSKTEEMGKGINESVLSTIDWGERLCRCVAAEDPVNVAWKDKMYIYRVYVIDVCRCL